MTNNELNKNELKRSIIIVIDPDGSHHICVPQDESLEWSQLSLDNFNNILTVINEPSFVLKFFLFVERTLQSLTDLLPTSKEH